MAYDLKGATKYLMCGGIGEVIGLADVAREFKQPKVQMDTDMAMALAILANEAVITRIKAVP